MTPDLSARPESSPLSPPQAAALVEKAQATLARQALRVGLLVEGCRRAGITIPGAPGRTRTLSPKGEQAVAHVERVMAEGGWMAGVIPTACEHWLRAQQAVQALEAALAAGAVDAPVMREAQLGVSLLTRFPERFQADPILADLFPPPPTQEVLIAPPLRPSVTRLSTPMTRAGRLTAYMEPHAAIIRLIAEMLDPTRSLRVRVITGVDANLARKMAQRLRRYPATVGRLVEAEALFVKLRKALAMRAPEAELVAMTERLHEMVQGFHRTLELGDMFVAGTAPVLDEPAEAYPA